MVRVRNRIELVLAWAMQRGLPARRPKPGAGWRGNLEATLPKPSKVNKPRALRGRVRSTTCTASCNACARSRAWAPRALEFAILTASRTGAVRQATWDEMDLQAAIWTIPAAHMKGNRPHRVPLPDRALELLEALPRFEDVALVFPGNKGKPLSDMTLTAGDAPVGPHSRAAWLSQRRSGTGQASGRPRRPRSAKMALAHTIGDKTEEAYRRGDLFEKRRDLMALWAKFIDTEPPKGNVRVIRGKAA